MKFLSAAKSDKGVSRQNNEDSFCIDEDLRLFIVADGMGGAAAGEVASRMAVEMIRDHIKRSSAGNEPFVGDYDKKFSDESNRIASGIRLANLAIYEASQSNVKWRGMGTTVAAVMLDNGKMSIAHTGDSRVYLIRANSIVQLTDDHSIVSEQIKSGLITKEEAEGSEIRNIITRALGTMPSVEVDLDEIDLMDADRVLLCSDGLTTMVPDNVILSIVAASDEPGSACSSLIDIANKNGGKDNITVALVYLFEDKTFLKKFKNLFR
ncbi:MAG: Stp1/IreP family PP2C-type Ser/Thr phosphatase [Nitrospiraceae bacterium]|nr:MAG: Stp1/IreP family PP2C-type Ser/Thr phosphatase [Nitrospiraceae bacterium]